MNQKLMAFWGYDLFPQVMLHGEVEKIGKDGFAVIKGYQGKAFKPLALLPYKDGEKIAELFETMKDEYDVKVAKARKEFKVKFEKEIPFKIYSHGIK